MLDAARESCEAPDQGIRGRGSFSQASGTIAQVGGKTSSEEPVERRGMSWASEVFSQEKECCCEQGGLRTACQPCEPRVGWAGVIRKGANVLPSVLGISESHDLLQRLEPICLGQARDVAGKRFEARWLRMQSQQLEGIALSNEPTR